MSVLGKNQGQRAWVGGKTDFHLHIVVIGKYFHLTAQYLKPEIPSSVELLKPWSMAAGILRGSDKGVGHREVNFIPSSEITHPPTPAGGPDNSQGSSSQESAVLQKSASPVFCPFSERFSLMMASVQDPKGLPRFRCPEGSQL